MSNFIQSEKVNKYNHEWEQLTVEALTMIKPLTQEGMTVLNPFMRSGTTGIASLELNRKFVGIGPTSLFKSRKKSYILIQ